MRWGRVWSALLLCVGVGLTSWSISREAGAARRPDRGARSVVGTWYIQRDIVPDQPIPVGVVYSFSADGTLHTSRSGAGYSGGHGAWKKRGRQILGTALYIRHDNTGQWSGTSKTWTDWELSADGETLSGRVHTDVIDLQGNVTQVVTATSVAKRVRAEDFPEAS